MEIVDWVVEINHRLGSGNMQYNTIYCCQSVYGCAEEVGVSIQLEVRVI